MSVTVDCLLWLCCDLVGFHFESIFRIWHSIIGHVIYSHVHSLLTVWMWMCFMFHIFISNLSALNCTEFRLVVWPYVVFLAINKMNSKRNWMEKRFHESNKTKWIFEYFVVASKRLEFFLGNWKSFGLGILKCAWLHLFHFQYFEWVSVEVKISLLITVKWL